MRDGRATASWSKLFAYGVLGDESRWYYDGGGGHGLFFGDRGCYFPTNCISSIILVSLT